MDQELNNKIDSLISKFENGQERYQKSAKEAIIYDNAY